MWDHFGNGSGSSLDNLTKHRVVINLLNRPRGVLFALVPVSQVTIHSLTIGVPSALAKQAGNFRKEKNVVGGCQHPPGIDTGLLHARPGAGDKLLKTAELVGDFFGLKLLQVARHLLALFSLRWRIVANTEWLGWIKSSASRWMIVFNHIERLRWIENNIAHE